MVDILDFVVDVTSKVLKTVDISSKSLRMEVAVMPFVKLHIFAFVPVKRATKFYVVSTIKVFHHNNKIKQSDSLLKT